MRDEFKVYYFASRVLAIDEEEFQTPRQRKFEESLHTTFWTKVVRNRIITSWYETWTEERQSDPRFIGCWILFTFLFMLYRTEDWQSFVTLLSSLDSLYNYVEGPAKEEDPEIEEQKREDSRMKVRIRETCNEMKWAIDEKAIAPEDKTVPSNLWELLSDLAVSFLKKALKQENTRMEKGCFGDEGEMSTQLMVTKGKYAKCMEDIKAFLLRHTERHPDISAFLAEEADECLQELGGILKGLEEESLESSEHGEFQDALEDGVPHELVKHWRTLSKSLSKIFQFISRWKR